MANTFLNQKSDSLYVLVAHFAAILHQTLLFFNVFLSEMPCRHARLAGQRRPSSFAEHGLGDGASRGASGGSLASHVGTRSSAMKCELCSYHLRFFD